MTRKRFIKLVMSHNIPRNEANRYASSVCLHGNYQDLYKHCNIYLKFEKADRQAAHAFKKATKGIKAMGKALEIRWNDITTALQKVNDIWQPYTGKNGQQKEVNHLEN